MKKLVLKSGLSYRYMGLSFKAGVPVPVEDDDKANYLISTGKFSFEDLHETETVVPIGDGNPENQDPSKDPHGNAITKKELSKMDKQAIAMYAASNGIDLTGCKTRENMIERVLETILPDEELEDGGDADTALDGLQ